MSVSQIISIPNVQTSSNFRFMLHVAVARFSSDSAAMGYLLPVLWMTSCTHILARRREKSVCSVTHEEAQRGERSLISTISVFFVIFAVLWFRVV